MRISANTIATTLLLGAILVDVGQVLLYKRMDATAKVSKLWKKSSLLHQDSILC